MATEPRAAPSLVTGQVIDGFLLGEHLHTGGMAHLWSVTRMECPAGAEAVPPLIMKVPRIRGGEDPAAIVGFEVEQMIMPTLTGGALAAAAPGQRTAAAGRGGEHRPACRQRAA
jgi:eukaryotic-like serine/threonine-protein kinase